MIGMVENDQADAAFVVAASAHDDDYYDAADEIICPDQLSTTKA